MKILILAAALSLAACGTGGMTITDAGQTGPTSTALGAPTGQQFWEGRWSPDGKKIALHHATVGSMGVDSIGVMEESGANLALIADAGTYLASVAWAPDGAAIYYSGNDGIFKIPAAGGASSLVKTAFAAMNIDVSKDGKRLTYSTNGSTSFYVLDLTDGGQTSIPNGEAARFSPDGTQLAYVARQDEPDGGNQEHFKLYKFADQSVSELGLAGTYLASICWFPDGKKLAVTSDDGIELLTPGQSPVGRSKVFDAFAATGCDVHPDGTKILYRVNGQLGLRVLTGF
jgi:Tol biopolymer transport system component